ncbi:MAG: hypothetical protein FWE82_07255 [Defluviitaleaceae bacterium]|nr:hypothetical protein [Defluviitaleaceae bacterium]
MRNLGDDWHDLQSDKNFNGVYEKRVIINGEVYCAGEIYALKKDLRLFAKDFTIGVCAAARLDLTIYPREGTAIPKNARVDLQARLVQPDSVKIKLRDADGLYLKDADGLQLIEAHRGATDWYSFGAFYVDSRKYTDNRLALECYDRMLFAERPFLDGEMLFADFPMPVHTALDYICTACGFVIDPQSRIDPGFMLNQHPIKATMRNVLGYIASGHGGNFIITDEGLLRLVVPENNAPLFELKSGNIKKKSNVETRRFDKLFFVINEEGEFYEAGSGETSLEIFNPFATQDITESVLKKISAYSYYPYNVQSADIDPAAEIGDPFDLHGERCNIWALHMRSSMFFDIDAPTAGDTAREFGFEGTQAQAAMRKTAVTEQKFAEISLTLDKFTLKLSNEYYSIADVDGIITETKNTLTSELTLTASQFNLFLQANSDYSQLTQTAGKVDWIVASGTSASNFQMTPRSIQLVADNINLTGYVTFNALSAPGQTSINGGNIIAGSLTVNSIFYGNYRIIGATGADTNPNIFIGDDPTGGTNIRKPATMKIRATNLTIGDYDVNNGITYVYGEKINLAAKHEILFGLPSNNRMYFWDRTGNFFLGPWSASDVGYLGESNTPWRWLHVRDARVQGDLTVNGISRFGENASSTTRIGIGTGSNVYIGNNDSNTYIGYGAYAWVDICTFNGRLGFFGKTPVTRRGGVSYLNPNTATEPQIARAVNELADVLFMYGLTSS